MSNYYNPVRIIKTENWLRELNFRIYDLKITFEHITDGREISITSNNNDFKEWNEDYK